MGRSGNKSQEIFITLMQICPRYISSGIIKGATSCQNMKMKVWLYVLYRTQLSSSGPDCSLPDLTDNQATLSRPKEIEIK